MAPTQASPNLKVYEDQVLRCTVALGSRLEIGRQQPDEPPPYYYDASSRRLVVAAKNNKRFSRQHVLIEQVDAIEIDGSSALQPVLRISNLSKKRTVKAESEVISPQESRELAAPMLLLLEGLAIRIECDEDVEWQYSQLGHQTIPPQLSGSPANMVETIGQMLAFTGSENSEAIPRLSRWLAEAMDLLRSAAGASDFYDQAVRSIARIVHLDLAIALRRTAGNWEVVSKHCEDSVEDTGLSQVPSQTILEKVLETKSTVCQLPRSALPVASLDGVSALVASPILDASGEVIGALYGVRYQTDQTTLPQISDLEATMVEVIACGTAAGIAREKEQEKAIAARVQFEQFFSPQLARELETNSSWLEGRECEVSILFCDVVRFSAISGRIGPKLTAEWISGVMDVLSEVVFEYDGVVVDYIGDELMAMWGAPKTQSDHFLRAAKASLAMHASATTLDQTWREILGEPVQFRVGICAGWANVGNTGSKHKFKYGPLGSTVNIASRLQSAAKHFGAKTLCSSLGTEAEAGEWLSADSVIAREIGELELVHIDQPIHALEIFTESNESSDLRQTCDNIQSRLRNGELRHASTLLDMAKEQFPEDTYLKLLNLRVEQLLDTGESQPLVAGADADFGGCWPLRWKLESK
ncbi:MAG: adenylate/guanylate cyclase domain-containing protein [Planctomycetota bacterium]